MKLSQNLNYDTMLSAVRVEDIDRLADTVAANLAVTIEEKQELLEIFNPVDRIHRLCDILDVEIEKLNVDRSINSRVKSQMEKAQKEYYLNEKMKAIQKELGRGEKSEVDELKKKIEAAGMPKEALEKAMQELKRLEMMPPHVCRVHSFSQLPRLVTGSSLEETFQGNSEDRACGKGSGKRSLRFGKD